MNTAITVLLIMYAVFTIYLIFGWLKIPYFKPTIFKNAKNVSQCQLSVVIVVRNEAENIIHLLQDLAAQTLPTALFEVWVVNDHSTDGTVELIEDYCSKAPYALHLLHLTAEDTHSSPKKAGITKAVKQAKGKYIVTTDGDCRVNAQWLELFHNFYIQTQAHLISGGVTLSPANTGFAKIQVVEFASLIGSGAATLHLGFPNMCNGANLSYAKKAFEEVNGFEGTAHIASGDDEFLMHKIALKYPKSVHFIKNKQSVVRTLPVTTGRKFFHQRKRWASKWGFYKDNKIKILAFFIFLCNFGLLFTFLMNLIGKYTWDVLILQLSLKCTIEFAFLSLVLSYFKKRQLIWWIPVVQFIYPLYVVFFGLLAQRKGTYEWKGRKLS